VPRSTTAPRADTGSGGGVRGGSGGSLGSGSNGGSVRGSTPRRDSGPIVGYDRGPTRRVDLPRGVAPTTSSKGGGLKAGGSGKSARPTKGPVGDVRSTTVKGWRDVRAESPKGSNVIGTTTRAIGRIHDVGVGVAAGAVGGVHPGGFHGGSGGSSNGDCFDDPCGWNNNNWCGGFSWCGSTWSCWWAWPWYWSCYYPWWFWSTSAYYYPSYAYYPAATTIVYPEPEYVYVQEQASQPVGEAVVNEAAPAGQPGTALSLAAQRYLELGDRAFREGRYTDAVQFYAKAVEFAPDQGALYLVLADALFAAGDYHYGAYAIRRALELDPSLIETTVDKHGFYPDPGSFDQQLTTLERYLADHGTDRDARLVLGLNYLFASRPKDAVRTIELGTGAMADDPAAQSVLRRARTLAQ